jgi:predicted Rossmann fold nucleotide-binding protein DprA/Smf involved in DNA uptake
MAKLVTSSNDILEEYNILDKSKNKEAKCIKFSDEMEKDIYNILILESLTINELIFKV